MGTIEIPDARVARVSREIELRQLRTLVAVVEAGTYTSAARRLRVSQSTVSEAMAALERIAGVPLVEKSRTGVALTPAGTVVLEHARRMEALAHELEAALAAASSEARSVLVVAAVESVGAYLLPSRLHALRGRWPGLRVEVTPGSCREIREAVAAGRTDVGLLLETSADRRGAEDLAEKRLALLCAPTHPLARARVTPREIASHDFLLGDTGGDYNDALRALFSGAGLPPPRMQSLGTIEGVKRGLLAAPAALALLPEHAVEAELRAGALAELNVRPDLPRIALRAVRSPKTAGSPIVEELLASFRQEPPRPGRDDARTPRT